MRSYSKNNVDSVVYEYFKHRKEDIHKGIFLDIGANDGIFANNTLLFESLGWDGVCIEGKPDLIDSLKKNRKCSCYHMVIAGDSKDTVFLEIPDQLVPGRSGLEEDITDITLNDIKRWDLPVTKSLVHTVSFMEMYHSLFSNIKHIDLLSLDIEGSEYKVLTSINFDDITFDCIIVEPNKYEQEITNLLLRNGYKLFRKFITKTDINWVFIQQVG